MYRLTAAFALLFTLACAPACDMADAESSRPKPPAPAAAAPEVISWEVEPIERLPDEIKGVWKADAYTIRQMYGDRLSHAEATEYADGIMLDVYPYNVHFKGMFGDQASMVVNQWFITPNDVYVGRGSIDLPYRGKVETTAYLRLHRNRLDVAFLQDDEKPDWDETYSLSRAK